MLMKPRPLPGKIWTGADREVIVANALVHQTIEGPDERRKQSKGVINKKLVGNCDDARHVSGEHDMDDHVGSLLSPYRSHMALSIYIIQSNSEYHRISH